MLVTSVGLLFRRDCTGEVAAAELDDEHDQHEQLDQEEGAAPVPLLSQETEGQTREDGANCKTIPPVVSDINAVRGRTYY